MLCCTVLSRAVLCRCPSLLRCRLCSASVIDALASRRPFRRACTSDAVRERIRPSSAMRRRVTNVVARFRSVLRVTYRRRLGLRDVRVASDVVPACVRRSGVVSVRPETAGVDSVDRGPRPSPPDVFVREAGRCGDCTSVLRGSRGRRWATPCARMSSVGPVHLWALIRRRRLVRQLRRRLRTGLRTGLRGTRPTNGMRTPRRFDAHGSRRGPAVGSHTGKATGAGLNVRNVTSEIVAVLSFRTTCRSRS